MSPSSPRKIADAAGSVDRAGVGAPRATFESSAPICPGHKDRAVGRIRRGVIGVLHDADHYLVIQRAACVAAGGAWCFPGGHVEPGENARRAVVRELHEELGIHVRPTFRLGAVPGRSDVMLVIWVVEHVAGSFDLNEREIAAMCWLTADEIRAMPAGLASNVPVVDRLERWRRGG